jgi:hypothetical protein
MPRGAGSMHTVMNGCMQDLGRSKKVVVPLDNIASLGSLPTRYDIPGLLDWAGLHRYAAFVAVLQAPGLVVGGVSFEFPPRTLFLKRKVVTTAYRQHNSVSQPAAAICAATASSILTHLHSCLPAHIPNRRIHEDGRAEYHLTTLAVDDERRRVHKGVG